MSKKWTHTAAFQFYGTEPRNPMWSWSARSEDRKMVVVTLWKDELVGRADQMVCARSDRGDWHDGPGYRFFMEDLAWAKDNCDGLVRVIIATPRIEDRQRRIDECYPQEKLIMRVTAANPATGAFTLEQVVTDATRP
jgi:hypothetical protein